MENVHKIWIAGAAGRLGGALAGRLDCREVELLATDRDDADVTDLGQALAFAGHNHPDVIVNCAAMTDPADCERDPDAAFQVNALGARNLAVAARQVGARLIHLSSGAVFGRWDPAPRSEFDRPDPDTAYGRSKLAGEAFVRELSLRHTILRCGWVYGPGDRDIGRALAAAGRAQPFPLACDRSGCPTSAGALADLILRLMTVPEYGLFHGVCRGGCSPYEFAREVLRLAGKTARLVPVPAAELPAGEAPAHPALDGRMLRLTGVCVMPDWREALARHMGGRA